MGPAKPSFAQIYTYLPKFIFNEDVYSYKGGFSSYSIYDLFLKTNGTTLLTIDKDNGFVGIGTLNPTEKLNLVGSANIHHDLKVQQNVEIQDQFLLADKESRAITKVDVSDRPNGVYFLNINRNGRVSKWQIVKIG